MGRWSRRVDKDLEGIDCGLFEGILAFGWRDTETKKTSGWPEVQLRF
jgi:hypothetical protein